MTNQLGWLRLVVRQRIRQGLRARLVEAWQGIQEDVDEPEEFEEESSPRQRRQRRSRPGQGRRRNLEQRGSEQRASRQERTERREGEREAAETKERRDRANSREERNEDQETTSKPAQEKAEAPVEAPASSSAKARTEMLYEIFDAMKGQSKEFLEDGRPRMEYVNRRLERRSEEASSREEVDTAFDAWQQANQARSTGK